MTFLLDVNVLIALIDQERVHHVQADIWFQQTGGDGWATCPITENGAIRIVGHPRYENALASPAVVADVLHRLRELGRHSFWPDDISLLDDALSRQEALTSHRQITDSYLLALAVKNAGRLGTFDRKLATSAVIGGDNALHVIPSG